MSNRKLNSNAKELKLGFLGSEREASESAGIPVAEMYQNILGPPGSPRGAIWIQDSAQKFRPNLELVPLDHLIKSMHLCHVAKIEAI